MLPEPTPGVSTGLSGPESGRDGIAEIRAAAARAQQIPPHWPHLIIRLTTDRLIGSRRTCGLVAGGIYAAYVRTDKEDAPVWVCSPAEHECDRELQPGEYEILVERTAPGLRRDVILDRMQTDHEEAAHAVSDVRDCGICCRRYGLDGPVEPLRWLEVREADGDFGGEQEPAWYFAERAR